MISEIITIQGKSGPNMGTRVWYFIVNGAEGKCDRAEAKQEVRKNIAAAV